MDGDGVLPAREADMMRCGSFLCLLIAVGVAASPSHGQEPPGELLDLFFDCSTGGCGDLDYLRREVPFVNWMRDRADADLHVLVTSQSTGGGGRLFTLAFIGLRDFAGQDGELRHSTAADATADEQRSRLVDRLKLGLVRYVQNTPAAELLRVTYGDADSGAAEPGAGGGGGGGQAPQSDSWDFWVFSVNASANANGEATSRFANTSGRVSANRTTAAWKIDLGVNYFQRVQEFEFTSGGVTQSIEETQRDWGTSALVARSLGARWAAGVRANAGSSTRINQDLRLSLQPGLEFSFFPYAESSRRSLTLQYLIGPEYFEYAERTIFGYTTETRFQESLTAGLSLIQPWGRWSTSVSASHYLHDLEKSNLTVFGNINVRLFRGFSVFANANYQWLRDQLYLSAEGATAEQILLRQRQLETSYRYFFNVGIQYRFGSIFNNVVNPRFGGGGGGEVIFF